MNQDVTAIIEAATAAVMCNGDTAAIPEYFTSDYVAHLTEEDFTGGHATLRKVAGMYRRSFPDIQVAIGILVVNDDRVAWQRTLRATHEASFKGFPATGQPIVWREMVVSRLHNGLIAEEWVTSDLAERLLLARKKLSK